jgi:hypothetical protein
VQVSDMADMQQIEAAIGKRDRFMLAAPHGNAPLQFLTT